MTITILATSEAVMFAGLTKIASSDPQVDSAYEGPVGISHFILHPSIDTPEPRAIVPDWQARVANYNVFMNDELKKFIESEDIKLIDYHQIRNAMRS